MTDLFASSSALAQARAPQSAQLGDGRALLQHWLGPARLPAFFAGVWEARPLLVRRPHAPALFAGLLSSGAIRSELQAGLEYTLDVDVVHYNGLVRSICMPRCCCIDAQRSSRAHVGLMYMSHSLSLLVDIAV